RKSPFLKPLATAVTKSRTSCSFFSRLARGSSPPGISTLSLMLAVLLSRVVSRPGPETEILRKAKGETGHPRVELGLQHGRPAGPRRPLGVRPQAHPPRLPSGGAAPPALAGRYGGEAPSCQRAGPAWPLAVGRHMPPDMSILL